MFRLECPFKVTVTCLKESRSNFASKIDGEMEEKAELKKKKKKKNPGSIDELCRAHNPVQSLGSRCL
jgi:hypothetical protein